MRQGRGWSALGWGLAAGLATLALLLVAGGEVSRRVQPTAPPSATPTPAAVTGSVSPPRPVPRASIEDGRVVVRLDAGERERIGLETTRLRPEAHRIEIQAYGSVLDLARVTELTNAYASAVAALQTAQAKAEVSRSALARAKSLGPYATQVQLETTEGAFQTDQAALAAAQSGVRTLSATAQQEWGPVIGRAIVERSGVITRLIERAEFLVQVTLPPGGVLAGPPGAAFAERPPQSARVPLAYVSPATRTDPRIQGLSWFYTAAGDSGLLPGMSTLAYLGSARAATGILVPEAAVVHWQGGAWFYRGVGAGAYARHPLKPDPETSADAAIVEDLPGETEVVLRGAQALLAEELKAQGSGAGALDDD